jgi:acylphosphatase
MADQTGVVEGDVETAEFADRSCDQRRDVGLGCDVSLLEDGAASVLLAVTDCRRAAFFIEVRNHDCGAFAGKTDCSRAAHAARRAGYYSDLIIEPSHFDDLMA